MRRRGSYLVTEIPRPTGRLLPLSAWRDNNRMPLRR